MSKVIFVLETEILSDWQTKQSHSSINFRFITGFDSRQSKISIRQNVQTA